MGVSLAQSKVLGTLNGSSLVQASETRKQEHAFDLASDLPGHCPNCVPD